MTRLSPDELAVNLAHFSGTESYHRTHPGLLATDGAHYLAEHAGAFWLLGIAWSVLHKIDDDFAVFELTRTQSSSEAVAHIHDGREPQTTFHRQHIPFTDFPLETIKLYLQDAGGEWVVMLPSEY